MKIDFLISSERSGSNLITKLVDNHSLYSGPTPTHILRVFNEKMEAYKDLENDNNWNLFITDILEFFNCKIAIWETNFTKEELSEVQPRKLSEVVKYIYRKEAEAHGKKNVFIKEIATYHFYDYLMKNFEEPKFIWLVRDPRDMALSWTRSSVHRGDIVRAANIWKDNQKRTFSLFQTNKNIKLIKYEELVSNQERELKKICEFLDIPYEPTMSDFHENKMSVKNATQTDDWKNLNKEIITDNFKKYKKSLSQKQIQYIEFVCQDEMKSLGYDFDFELLERSEFETIELELKEKERHEKPEYQLIDDSEKEKRINWYNKFTEIQGR